MIVGNASTLYHDLNMQNLIYDKDFKVSKKTLRLTYDWAQLVLTTCFESYFLPGDCFHLVLNPALSPPLVTQYCLLFSRPKPSHLRTRHVREMVPQVWIDWITAKLCMITDFIRTHILIPNLLERFKHCKKYFGHAILKSNFSNGQCTGVG
jgi:hypothetical protein